MDRPMQRAEKIIGGSITKREVEDKLKNMGDYVKIDYLSRTLKGNIDYDTKKFILNKLAILYEQRGMFSDSARLMANAAEINTTFENKMGDYYKAAEMFIKAGSFDEADLTFNKALVCGNDRQKVELKIKRREAFKAQAKEYMKRDKRKHACLTYEKIISLPDLTTQERQEAHNALLGLYEKLGMVKEFYNLKKAGVNPPKDVKTAERKDFRTMSRGPSAADLLKDL